LQICVYIIDVGLLPRFKQHGTHLFFLCVCDSVVIIDDDDGHVEDHGGEVRADTPAKACMWHKMKDQASPAYFVP
jgi:hypothetical protein